MEAYTTRIKSTAEHLAKETFPQKALELDSLLSSDQFLTSNISKIIHETDLPRSEDFIQQLVSSKSSELVKENLDELVNAVASTKKRKIDYQEVGGCKVIMFPTGAIQTNQRISDMIKQIKPFVIHFLDASASLKLWIQILIPQVEDFKAELSLQIQVSLIFRIVFSIYL